MKPDHQLGLINYEDLEDWKQVSSGSFGYVYKADYMGTEVAVKMFLDMKEIPQFNLEKYTTREVAILKEARHPNVVQFLGSCINEGKIYVVTEFVNGGNLSEFLTDQKNDISWRMKLNFAQDCARALVYLHANNIIHRDLKSDNLLVTENKRIKICDFGMSRKEARNEEEASTLSYCGTDAFMAPEIMLGMPFDVKIDIFSFGIILLEIILRVSAQSKDDSSRVFERLVPGFGIDQERVRELTPPDCPKNLFNLAFDCLNEDPAKRPGMKDILKKLISIEEEIQATTQTAITNIGLVNGSDTFEGPLSNSINSSKKNEQSPKSSKPSLNRSSISSPPIKSPISNISFFPPEGNLHRKRSTSSKKSWSDKHQDFSTSYHRFSLVKLTSQIFSKCSVCSSLLGIAHRHLACDDCGVKVHKNCAALAKVHCSNDVDQIREDESQ